MADISSDGDLRAHIRAELGLTDASRVPDEAIEAQIRRAKRHLSDEVAYKVNEDGDDLSFYGDHGTEMLTFFCLIRHKPLAANAGGGPGGGGSRIPPDWPGTVSHMARTDFGDETTNYWRDRLLRARSRL